MPIWSYVIEHPDGLFVVDAGASPSYNDPHSWRPDPRAGAVIRSFIKLAVEDGATLPGQWSTLDSTPRTFGALILTHQHIDHTGTVPSFPRADIWTTRAEDSAAGRIGALHWRWRDGSTRIRHVDVEGTRTDLGTTVTLTEDGALSAIHTPGHTPGSVTVRLQPIRRISGSPATPRSPPTAWTLRRRRRHPHRYAAGAGTAFPPAAGPALILPSHDPTVPDRLGAVPSGEPR